MTEWTSLQPGGPEARRGLTEVGWPFPYIWTSQRKVRNSVRAGPTIPYNIENSWLIQPYLPWRNWQRVVNGELGVVLFHGVNEGPPRKKPRCSATDTMEITIKVGDTVVSSISGTLSGGNHQAHDE